jgi:HAD superfamily hydrolase (TIGR01662 family)
MGLLLLDLDGTLVADALVEVDGKLQRPQDQRFHEPVLLPGVFDRLSGAAADGERFSIVTNQGGVAWGYHTAAEVRQRIGRTLEQLEFFWGRPFTVHVAWKHPRATVPQFRGDDGRKPAPDMLRAALVEHYEDHTLYADRPVRMIGDRQEDQEAAAALGCDFSFAGDFFDR